MNPLDALSPELWAVVVALAFVVLFVPVGRFAERVTEHRRQMKHQRHWMSEDAVRRAQLELLTRIRGGR